MKRIKYILLAVVSSTFLLQACSEDKMDDINGNKNNPEYITAKYLLADVEVATSFSVTASDLAFYTSIYTELLSGVQNQTYRAQMRTGEPQLASTYNNKWNDIYRQLRSLKDVVAKCSEGGKEQGNYQALGIAQILSAYNWALLTDLFGDVPMTEALQPGVNFQPKVDKQEDIYKEVFKLLDAAIENLQKTSNYASIGGQDLLYSGDSSKWIKAANGLKARYTMRLSFRNADYTKVIELVDASFKVASEEFKMKAQGIPYPFYLFELQRAGLASSSTFYETMKDNNENDPRLESFFVPIGLDKKVVLADNKTVFKEGTNIYSPSGLSAKGPGDEMKANNENPIYLLSYHELLFVKAEAQARLGLIDEANVTLKEAVVAGYAKSQRLSYKVDPSVTKDVKDQKELIAKIAVEKYISFFEVESIEAYNDIRRWDAMGEEPIKLQNPENDKGFFPQRLSYGQTDVVNNDNIKALFGDGSYVYKEKVWWAGGNR